MDLRRASREKSVSRRNSRDSIVPANSDHKRKLFDFCFFWKCLDVLLFVEQFFLQTQHDLVAGAWK